MDAIDWPRALRAAELPDPAVTPWINQTWLADLLGVDRESVGRAARDGKLPAPARRGNRICWNVAELHQVVGL